MIAENKYETVPAEHDDFPLRLRRYDGAAKFMMHWHGHMELLYFIKGGASVYCGGEEILTQDGDLITVNPNELHRGDYRETGVEYLCVMLPPHFFEWCGEDERYILERRVKNDERIKELFHEIFESFEKKADGYRYESLGTAYKIVSYLAQNYTAARLGRNEYEERNSRLENFNNVIEYIGKPYSEQLTTPVAAQMVHISECYFCHLFRQHMGVNFTTYLNQVRVHKATALLQNTKLSITQIASETGFNDVNYFSRVFKKCIGISPRKYREKQ